MLGSEGSELTVLSTFLMIKGECMISKILVPSDGSKTAKKAAAYAVDLAKQLKASIIILSVIDQRSLIAWTVPASEAAKAHHRAYWRLSERSCRRVYRRNKETVR